MEDKKYLDIVAHYESCLEQYGDTHLGVDWPKAEDVATRYRVMLDVMRPEDVAASRASGRKLSLLDFGCGASHLYEHMRARGFEHVEYAGLDLSEKFVALSRRKYPSNEYFCLDVLDDEARLPEFDYVLMNGVFTEKKGLSFDEMFAYFKRLLVKVFARARVGVAFNVMTKHVDWERDDLFHLPFDTLAAFLKKELTRHFVFRNDYGLYEYTTYAYR
jgi:SAM-dependent methyltransferase